MLLQSRLTFYSIVLIVLQCLNALPAPWSLLTNLPSTILPQSSPAVSPIQNDVRSDVVVSFTSEGSTDGTKDVVPSTVCCSQIMVERDSHC